MTLISVGAITLTGLLENKRDQKIKITETNTFEKKIQIDKYLE